MGSMSDQEKLRILLAYWIEHNLDHAQDFRQWAQRAEAFGSKEAASKLVAAAQEVTAVNDSLKTALDLL
jgi:hypothetical protein